MKISGVDPGFARIDLERPETPGSVPGTGGFADLLNQALREPAATPAAALSVPTAAGLRPAAPAEAVQAAFRVESFLDLLECYRQKLADPRTDMQVLSGAVRDVEKGMASLTPALSSLPENDGLKEIIQGALVTASVEIAKFRRGDYPAA